ncbi:MAG TPA: hypothetical protein VK864_02940 [Longimicrobiales bacterium]|nr:hypothetical protein [Longimicrobiales bacterium]
MTSPIAALLAAAQAADAADASWLDVVRNGFTPVAYAIVLGALLIIVIALLVGLLRALGRGDVPRVESWDGFGGGLGGWQMSRSLALLIGAVLFASVSAMTLRAAARDVRPVPRAVVPDTAAQSAQADTTAADSARDTARRPPATARPPAARTPAAPDSPRAATTTTTTGE